MSARMTHRAWLAALALGAVLAGCASTKPVAPPLEAVTGADTAQVVWRLKLDSVQFPLITSAHNGVFTVAGSDGNVVALEADTGRELWRGQAGARLSAGVGSDGRFASVVTRDAVLVTFEAGRVLWRRPLGVRVDTAPFVAGERIFVLASDRSVQAFDALDGTPLWKQQRPGDPLTLTQSGVITAYKNRLLVGQGPKLAALDPSSGQIEWEVPIGSPRGVNEIERLADLVGPAVRAGELLCARSFQAAVGCVNAERGALVWSKPVGGTDAVAGDAQGLIGADAGDRITAWRGATGEVAWTSEKLLHRGLGTPAMDGDAVLFGDAAGTLHWLSRSNGAALARLATDGSAIVAAPAAAGSTLLVATRAGGIFGVRLNRR